MINIPDQRLVPWAVDHILEKRRFVFIAIILITILSGWICSHAIIASSVGKLFFGESPKYQQYLEANTQIGSDIQILIGLEDIDQWRPIPL